MKEQIFQVIESVNRRRVRVRRPRPGKTGGLLRKMNLRHLTEEIVTEPSSKPCRGPRFAVRDRRSVEELVIEGDLPVVFTLNGGECLALVIGPVDAPADECADN